ncbi:MAG: hypothetical protein HND48_24470 [Chloroflexi bacterium]|nr:hypothetical protein [Chloroflexota bacterium]
MGTKIAGKPVGKLVNTISGGTQDDEGLLKAIPSVPALAGEITDTVASILLIKDGNSAQQKLGEKKLRDNIFSVFKAVANVTRRTLRVVEQFRLQRGDRVHRRDHCAHRPRRAHRRHHHQHRHDGEGGDRRGHSGIARNQVTRISARKPRAAATNSRRP